MNHVFHVMDGTIGEGANGSVILTQMTDAEDGKEEYSHCNKTQEDLPSIAFHVCV